MSEDIERIPSMRKPTRQGVPKRTPRDMAKPAQTGQTRDAPPVRPRTLAGPPAEPTLPLEPTLPPMPEPEAVAAGPQAEPEPEPIASAAAPQAEPEPEPIASAAAPQAEPEPEPIATAAAPQAEPEPEPLDLVDPEPVFVPEPEDWPAPEPAKPSAPAGPPLTLRGMLTQVDSAWFAFRAAAFRVPAEHMDDHLTDGGWTRKQMLAHIARWHDLTSDRLVKLALTGKPAPLELDIEAINAAAARVAIGKTAGEVLKDVEATFNRLRRQMQRLTDEQLRLGDAWAAQVIAGNTYEHYAEHMADLVPPPPIEGVTIRR